MPTTKRYEPGEEKIAEAMAAFFAKQTDDVMLDVLGDQEYRLCLLEIGINEGGCNHDTHL